MVCDAMGWDMKHINDMMKEEQSTNFDKRYRKLLDDKSDKDKDFQNGILSGKKYKEILEELFETVL